MVIKKNQNRHRYVYIDKTNIQDMSVFTRSSIKHIVCFEWRKLKNSKSHKDLILCFTASNICLQFMYVFKQNI